VCSNHPHSQVNVQHTHTHTHVNAISNETMKVYGKAWFKSYGTVHLTDFQSLHFVSSTGRSRGVSLVGYKQLESAVCSMLPNIGQTKSLFFVQYWYYTMALSKIGKHTVIHCQGHDMAYNVSKFMTMKK